MKNTRLYVKPLLYLHLFVCLVWLMAFRGMIGPGSNWAGHVIVWSIMAIQFTWGLTVGLIVGPDRSRRKSLWWSMLTVFMPLWPISITCMLVCAYVGPLIGMVYLLGFVLILACETFCGVLTGVKLHSRHKIE